MTDLVFVLAVTVPLALALLVGVVMAVMGIVSFRSRGDGDGALRP